MKDRDLIVTTCAMAAHEANRIYCSALGDSSQVRWEDAPDWQKTSAVKGVEGVLAGNGPEASHEAWLEEKRATGWRYGPTKDPEKREHPCFVPYAELPPDQKQKDAIFVGIVRLMSAALGATITYPATSDTPERTIDWSKTPTRIE